jgi:hypothetical protein
MIVLCVAGRGRFHQPPSASNGLPPASITGAPHAPSSSGAASGQPRYLPTDFLVVAGTTSISANQAVVPAWDRASLASRRDARPAQSRRNLPGLRATMQSKPGRPQPAAGRPPGHRRRIVRLSGRLGGVALPGYVRNVSAVGGERDSAVGERYGGGDGSGCCLIERWCRPQACQDGAAGRPTERLGNGGDSVCSPLQPSLVAFQRRLQPRSAAP